MLKFGLIRKLEKIWIYSTKLDIYMFYLLAR